MDKSDEETGANVTGLLELLLRSGRHTEARLDVALAEVGLSVAKWAALRHLVRAEEPLALGQLAERLACVKSNATQLVDRLEAERLVRRVPDPADRRSIRVALTPEGRQRYAAGQAVFRATAGELFREYSPADQEQFVQFLARLESGQAHS